VRHIVYEESDTYPIALLIKASAFNKEELRFNYVDPMVKRGIAQGQIIAMTLAYTPSNKAPVKYIKTYLDDLLPALDSVGVETVYVADANYFKVLTKCQQAAPNLGYILPCTYPGYEHMKVILGVNHKSLLYDPGNEPKLTMSVQTLCDEILGSYQPLGEDIIHFAEYPSDRNEIAFWLNKLMAYPDLSCDIEAGSLEFDKAGIATVTFCWNQHEGIAFPVDYVSLDEPVDGVHGKLVHNPEIKRLLKGFFEEYRGTLKWHNCTYDTKVIIYELWMDDLLDTKGLLTGLHVLHQRIHDTRIITYLATNTTAGNSLSLKDLAHEFAGNYGMGDNIKDVRKIPLDKLLKYNLIDGLATNWVFNTYYPIMVQDQQEAIYHDIMMPSQKVITQVELTGMPMNPTKVQHARKKLEAIKAEQEKAFVDHPVIKALETKLTYLAWEKDFKDRKDKAKNPDKLHPKDRATFPHSVFNPNSGPQLQKLLYEAMGLPVIDKTKTKLPATGAKTIVKLLNHTENPEYIRTLEALMAWTQADKILSTFIPAFERAIDKDDGVVYLHGSFNLGGTKSGRLSSSDPNMQNIPAGSTYGKLIKSCFEAPKGWLFAGADFNSLEDYISALTTKDPAKLKVYEEGYDGHTLRAFTYWPEKFPWDELTPERSHDAKTDPVLKKVRAKSKNPTFALTYQGTWHTLVNTLGFSSADAKAIEANYHVLYEVSDKWVQDRLDQAGIDGFITGAFGLRLRTPLLGMTIRGKSSTPYEAEAEGRTAGNALGQSYGLLTNRSMNEFMQKVWQSRFRYDIRPCAMIHDANYLMIRDDIDVVEWVNRELIKSMEWQDLPELEHPTVKLGAALDIFYPTWADECTLPNYASQKEIRAKCADFQAELADKQKEAA